VESERIVGQPYEVVWRSLLDFCHENNFEITERDTATGFLSFTATAERHDLDSAFDCGHLSSVDGNLSSPEFKCNIILRRASWESTLVTVKPFETAMLHLNTDDRNTRIECNSTGLFEHRVFDYLTGTKTVFQTERIQEIDSTPPEAETEISNWRLSVGAAMIPFTMRGVRDVHISDWQRHGNNSDEGRLLIPLSTLKTSGNHGGLMGAIGYDVGALTPFAELQFDFPAGGTAVSIELGTLYHIAHSENLSLSLASKFGWLGTYTDVGPLEFVSQKFGSVELAQRTLNEGDTLEARIDGFNAQIGLDAEYSITERLALYVSGSYSRTWFGGLRLKAGDDVLDLNSSAIVEPSVDANGFGSTTHATL
jgi:hypothetical protein